MNYKNGTCEATIQPTEDPDLPYKILRFIHKNFDRTV